MRKTILLLLVLIQAIAIRAQQISVIPKPVSVKCKQGVLIIPNQVQIRASKGLKNEANMLKKYLSDDFDMSTAKASNVAIKLVLKHKQDKENNSYTLTVGNDIVIASSTSTGIFYGIQTLRQLISKAEKQYKIQKLTIYDYPSFQWRAFMLDEGRYFKGKQVVMNMLDEMAKLKMNVFHWHLTDDQGWRIEIKKYPMLTQIGSHRDSTEINNFGSNVYDGKPHRGFYTQKEIKKILAYAAKRHINIVPEIEMPGHASAAIASYPWLSTDKKSIAVPGKLGVHYNVYNVADPKVVEYIHNVLNEVLALFPSSVIHIGGDEVKYNHWKESAEVQDYMKANKIKTPAELQVFFTNNISNWLASKNRRMMGWNEITGANLHPFQSKEDAARKDGCQLSKSSIVQYWVGEESMIVNTIKAGYDIVNSCCNYTYLDYNFGIEQAYAFNPIPKGLTKEEEKHVLGIGCQMWGEFIPTAQSMYKKVFPRLAAYAEVGWLPYDKRDIKDFTQRVKDFYNGDPIVSSK